MAGRNVGWVQNTRGDGSREGISICVDEGQSEDTTNRHRWNRERWKGGNCRAPRWVSPFTGGREARCIIHPLPKGYRRGSPHLTTATQERASLTQNKGIQVDILCYHREILNLIFAKNSFAPDKLYMIRQVHHNLPWDTHTHTHTHLRVNNGRRVPVDHKRESRLICVSVCACVCVCVCVYTCYYTLSYHHAHPSQQTAE